MASGQCDRAKERHWRQHVAAWRRSGWSVRAYCDSEGLSEPSFYGWRRVLAERDLRAAGNGVASDKAAATPAHGRAASATAHAAVSPFVPVRIVEDAAPAPAVEIVLRGGLVVRVTAGFMAKTLRDVVAALEDLPC